MGKVSVSLTMSLDGFIAGPHDGPDQPLGKGGDRLFTWMNAGPESNRVSEWLAPPDASKSVIDGWQSECGAIVSGRRTFDIARGWKNGHPIDVPIFVVTHEPPTYGEWSPRVTFVTEGLERAVGLAHEAAGDLAVSVCAANPVQQLLRAGKLDEIEVSVVPYLLGAGVRLFDNLGPDPIELEQTSVIESTGVTHLRYRPPHLILPCLTDDVTWDLPGYTRPTGKEAFDQEIENAPVACCWLEGPASGRAESHRAGAGAGLAGGGRHGGVGREGGGVGRRRSRHAGAGRRDSGP